ncbi:GGDEF domain-containing protein [Bacillus sp. Marseille-P3661]|uniref:GGDEF domain-containing protein n=1 Tax=Bacillus sp. Marseille-P3661 TaxID=1936234 RepID=UPI0015E168FB|nr:GGDEF domain-containing protein [Bacillus sp. Marseille-P3661]
MNIAIQSCLSNIAIIFLMHLCIDTLILKRNNIKKFYFDIAMITTVSIAVIIMFYLPIRYGGYQFDLRFIPLVFFAIKWGWKYVIPALIITIFWRLGMGGAGALPGVIFGMALPTLVTLFIMKIKKSTITSVILFYIINMAWLISDLPIIYLVPDGWNVFKEIALLRFISFNLTAFTLYFFINSMENEVKLKEKLQYYAERDPLTGLYNIGYLEAKICSYSKKDKKMYIIMADIDHFKSINDTYGHLNGDHIIKSVAKVIVDSTEKANGNEVVVGRYGGEEFIIFLATDNERKMIELVESIRYQIENTHFCTEDMERRVNLTVSIGVSQLPESANLHDAIKHADHSLYDSKKNGRNQISYS